MSFGWRIAMTGAALLLLSGWQIPKRGYVGPGDNSAFTAWYGVRAYNAAKAAARANIADLRRVSDNATCTVKLKTNGDADVDADLSCNGASQTVTAWIGASSAKISKLYDQTAGNACSGASCDVLQATASHQPEFLLNCNGSKPCIKLAGASNTLELVGANNITPTGGSISFVGVANRTTSTQNGVITSSNGIDTIQVPSIANRMGLIHNNTTCNTPTANDATWHSVVGAMVNSPGTSTVNVDGTETTSTSANCVVSTTAGKPAVATSLSFSSVVLDIGEGGFADAIAFNSTARTNLCHNMRLYWGTGGSC